MPCDTISILENNGDEAEKFVREIIDKGNVPSKIKYMPSEFQNAFTKIINAAYNFPEHRQGKAHDSISSAVSVFDDFENGYRRSDVNQRITSVFAEISAGPIRTCQAENCPASTSSAQSCSIRITKSASPTETNNNSFTKAASSGTALPKKSTPKVTTPSVPKNSSSPSIAFSNISRPFSSAPTAPLESQHANFGSKIASSPFGSTSIGVWAGDHPRDIRRGCPFVMVCLFVLRNFRGHSSSEKADEISVADNESTCGYNERLVFDFSLFVLPFPPFWIMILENAY